jgi:hypothetical protein
VDQHGAARRGAAAGRLAEQQAALLPSLAAGEVKGAVALLRPGSSTPAGAPATADAEGRLSGRLELVEYAEVADRLLVATPDGPAPGRPARGGRDDHRSRDAGPHLAARTVVLDGAPAERLPGSSPEVLQELLDRAAVLVANELVGLARFALMDTVEYDKTRVQFGKPVGSFQAIKHDLADLHMRTTMAEHAGWYAAHAADVGRDDRELAASIAKAKATDVAFEVTGAMIQYHGGIGYTWEHHAHFYWKRAQRPAAHLRRRRPAPRADRPARAGRRPAAGQPARGHRGGRRGDRRLAGHRRAGRGDRMSLRVLVTGGASGFGAEVARQLTARGDAVVLCDVDEAAARPSPDELGATFLPCDVSDLDAVRATTTRPSRALAGWTRCSSTPGSRPAAASATTSTSSATAGPTGSTWTASSTACTPRSRPCAAAAVARSSPRPRWPA